MSYNPQMAYDALTLDEIADLWISTHDERVNNTTDNHKLMLSMRTHLVEVYTEKVHKTKNKPHSDS